MQTADNPITKRRYASCKCEPFSFSTKVTGLKKHLAKRGMSDVNLMTGWEKIVGYGLAKYSFPDWIKNISGVKTLCIKVLETRILECQHQKPDILQRINLTAGYHFIDDIRFFRVQKLPKSKYQMAKMPVDIPITPHPFLTEQTTAFQDKTLENAFNVLAHYVIPIVKQNNQGVAEPHKSVDNPVYKTDSAGDKPKKSWLVQLEQQQSQQKKV